MTDVRATYLRFPAWTQHFWTWQTGKALPGQKPLLRHTWASYLTLTLALFLGGLAVSATAVAAEYPYWYLALLAGWFLTVCGARMMVLVIAHQALHRRFSGMAARDGFWGETVTVLSVFHTFREFKEEHFDNHHRREIFATEADPPVQFLRSARLPSGDEPGPAVAPGVDRVLLPGVLRPQRLRPGCAATSSTAASASSACCSGSADGFRCRSGRLTAAGFCCWRS